MDVHQIFRRYDWIAQGRAWATAPPGLRRIAREFFMIPQVHEQELLSSPFLPIAKLLEFRLPLQNATVTAPQPAQYFSTVAPDIDDAALMLRIRHLAIPDAKTVNKLLACSRQCWLDGVQSVVYSHLGGVISHFPLWILTYWAAVGEIKRDTWGPWRNFQEWINSQKKISRVNPIRAALAEEAALMLTMLPWSCRKPPAIRIWSRTLASGEQRWSQKSSKHIALQEMVSRERPVVRYGDSFGSPILEELAAACDWWLGQHTFAEITRADLPIARQEDGFSCGMLVDNSHQHFVDPNIPLDAPTHVANARLEVFNRIAARGLEQLEIERALAIAEDEDSDDRSDQNTAPSAALDTDSDVPIPLLHRTARRAKFTFTCAAPSPAPSPLPVRSTCPTAGKRPKGHPDAPTPNPSPQKRRIFERQADGDVSSPKQPIFGPRRSSSPQSAMVDVFECGSESGGEAPAGVDNAHKYLWGPEDDAPIPPESQTQMSQEDSHSQSSTFFTTSTSTSDTAIDSESFNDLPALQNISDSEEDESGNESAASGSMPDLEDVDNTDDEEEDAAHPFRSTQPSQLWRRALRLEKDGREYSAGAEQARLREVDEKRKKQARDRIASGWVPGTKRKRVDLLDHDDSPAPDPRLAELSRPFRQFKEDGKKDNKPCGRKQKDKNAKRDAKNINWQHPLLWTQIVEATRRAGRPWKPRAILRELLKSNFNDFHRLREQVIGAWITKEGGTSRWKDAVLQRAEEGKGNAPGGQTTRCGVVHPYPETRRKINEQLTSLRGAGVFLTLLSIRGIMVGHIMNDAPELFDRTMGDVSLLEGSLTLAQTKTPTVSVYNRFQTVLTVSVSI
ncbi:hypothetical protein B0H19DRAFT_1340110 [Mycena capillaripes]|nr:hypothetical protein B0H19DRAFT_1340110 [Mycena capillaripes]